MYITHYIKNYDSTFSRADFLSAGINVLNKNTPKQTTAKIIPIVYEIPADNLNPSSAYKIYVQVTADINVAGKAAINDDIGLANPAYFAK